MHLPGIVFALTALVCWGIGDYLIQRTARRDGNIEALFCIGVVSMAGIFPFVYRDLGSLSVHQLSLLAMTGVISVTASWFTFEALRVGKIAIVEPIIGLELPIVVAITVFAVGEHLSLLTVALIFAVFLGTMLVVVTDLPRKAHHLLLERGSLLAFVAAFGTALTTVFIGLSSQATSALVAVWFAHTMIAVVTGTVLMKRKGFGKLADDIRSSPWPVIGESVFDTCAWIAFAFAASVLPISIATAISGGYVAFAVLLGVFVSRERLYRRQVLGVIAVIAGVTALSLIW